MCLDIWNHIVDYSDFKTKLKILKLSIDYYNYSYIISEITFDHSKLTDDILRQKKYIKMKILNAFNNEKITDEEIKHHCRIYR